MAADAPDSNGSAFDLIVSSVDGPMIVVTTAEGGERAGCLVGFHAQSSIEPRRYTVWLSKANHTYRVALRASHIGIHFLTDGDFALAERFGTLTGVGSDTVIVNGSAYPVREGAALIVNGVKVPLSLALVIVLDHQTVTLTLEAGTVVTLSVTLSAPPTDLFPIPSSASARGALAG